MIGRPAEAGDLYLIQLRGDTHGEGRYFTVEIIHDIRQVYFGKIGVNVCEMVVWGFYPFCRY